MNNENQKGFALIMVVIALVVLAGLVGGGWYVKKKVLTKNAPVQKACTQEARQCPDGKTYVGRTGPNCEFAQCPSGSDKVDTSNWKTYRNEKYGFEVKYPPAWFAKDTSEGSGYALYEVSLYPVNPDEFCTNLQRNSQWGFLCGISPALQIYATRIAQEPIFKKNFEFEYGISVSELEMNQILSTFKFIK